MSTIIKIPVDVIAGLDPKALYINDLPRKQKKALKKKIAKILVDLIKKEFGNDL